MAHFTPPADVSHYPQGPARLVPGFADLHRMAALLLAERTPAQARVLVLGAGGGLELQVFAATQPGWHFVGVDPSAPMLEQAARTTAEHSARIDWVEGLIHDAPQGPYDAASCILTLHFVPQAERLATLAALRARMKPGAPLVIAHHSFAQDEPAKSRWLKRYAAFANLNGVPLENALTAGREIGRRLPILDPKDEEALLVQAGFTEVELFYAAFSFRGWVAVAG